MGEQTMTGGWQPWLAGVVVVLVLGASACAHAARREVYDLAGPQFQAQALEDVAVLQRYSAGMQAVLEQLRASGSLAEDRTTPYPPEERQALLSSWAVLYDYLVGTEFIRQRYWDFVKVPAVTRVVPHTWGYLLTHTALTLELAHGLAFVDLAAGKSQLEVLLDEPDPELGIPPRAFSALKLKVIHVSTSTQLATGDAYAKGLPLLLKQAGLQGLPEVEWLRGELRVRSAAAGELLKRRGVKLYLGQAVDLTKDESARAVFPVQQHVAEWMGDTRVRRVGRPLIREEQVLALLTRMEPGDVIVSRQNWYLSNIGLPGFWPHAELYLGRPEELAAYFDQDPEVRAFVTAQPEGVATFSELLAARHPRAWAAYQGLDLQQQPIRILEAMSEGVSFTGHPHGMVNDYVGVMRPRLTRAEKAQALLRAFGYQGRPYDFNFDFFSDRELVCTELVYKSYQPTAGLRGLNLPLVTVAGRRTLPANELVRLFDREYDTPGRQLDFVGFLDGREREERAVEGDVESFRQSHRRVKWDVAQR